MSEETSGVVADNEPWLAAIEDRLEQVWVVGGEACDGSRAKHYVGNARDGHGGQASRHSAKRCIEVGLHKGRRRQKHNRETKCGVALAVADEERE